MGKRHRCRRRPSRPTVGLVVLARDEEQSLPRLLASIAGHVDEVVLVDTGSTDRTVSLFEGWAGETGTAHTVGRFRWVDDFVLARAYADSLATCDWLVWADADDEIRGAEHLRRLAAGAPRRIAGFAMDYAYAFDASGNCSSRYPRERLVRAGRGAWGGNRIHAVKTVDGPVRYVPPTVVEWVHHKRPGADVASSAWRLRVLRHQLAAEPANPGVLCYLGCEELFAGEFDAAIGHFRRYLDVRSGWDDERAWVTRKLAEARMRQRHFREVLEPAREALRRVPGWPDSCLTLCEAYYHLGDMGAAAYWAKQVIRRGVPKTVLDINPLNYTQQPRLILADCHARRERPSAAIELYRECLAVTPDDERIHAELARLEAQLPTES